MKFYLTALWLSVAMVLGIGVMHGCENEVAHERTVDVDDDQVSTNFEFQRMTMASIRKKQVRRVVEYGPYIPTLVRLLEEGYFE